MDTPVTDETIPQRYRREAKARLAAHLGEDLAEEFFSVAADTLLNVESVAELMAAAYLMGCDEILLPDGIHSYRRLL